MALSGTASVEIDAPIQTVYDIAAEPGIAPKWQPEIKSADVIETDGAGQQTKVVMKTDLKVKTIDVTMRFSYTPTSGLSWVQEKGALKSIEGRWEFEDLGGDRTKATIHMDVDFGRTLGMVIRGPLVDVLRGQLVESMPGKLKAYVEAQG